MQCARRESKWNALHEVKLFIFVALLAIHPIRHIRNYRAFVFLLLVVACAFAAALTG